MVTQLLLSVSIRRRFFGDNARRTLSLGGYLGK